MNSKIRKQLFIDLCLELLPNIDTNKNSFLASISPFIRIQDISLIVDNKSTDSLLNKICTIDMNTASDKDILNTIKRIKASTLEINQKKYITIIFIYFIEFQAIEINYKIKSIYFNGHDQALFIINNIVNNGNYKIMDIDLIDMMDRLPKIYGDSNSNNENSRNCCRSCNCTIL
jgi:hypothetical protein